MEKSDGRLKFSRKRPSLKVSVGMTGFSVALDIADREDHYLAVTGG